MYKFIAFYTVEHDTWEIMSIDRSVNIWLSLHFFIFTIKKFNKKSPWLVYYWIFLTQSSLKHRGTAYAWLEYDVVSFHVCINKTM